jgi:hypothetical protein
MNSLKNIIDDNLQDSIKRIIAENTSYIVDDLVYDKVRLEVLINMAFYPWDIILYEKS